MKLEIVSHNEKETICIGRQIGRLLRGGEIILLDSDLGGGKTALTKGLAEGIGSVDDVTSPTFAINQTYKGIKLEIHHYDLYRLDTLGEVVYEMQEFLKEPNSVVVIEWPGLAEDVLANREKIIIKIERQKSSEGDRLIIVDYPKSLEYAIDADLLKDCLC
jgi:tRNA threonylcarbamoyladenosine biosynthesis protein TsaE